MPRREELTDEQWALIEPLLPKLKQGGRGRPPRDTRAVMNGILWILRSGARWKDLPERFPPYQTCHRRFQQWVRAAALQAALKALAEHLRSRGGLDLSECFIDASFAVAKKGALAWVPLSGARARNSWQLRTLMVFLSPCTQRLLRPTRRGSSSRPSRAASPAVNPRG